MQKRMLVVGGGASGLLCAICAKEILGDKAEVEIIEKAERVGRKLLATGNGQCNLTNANASIGNYYGKSLSKIEAVLSKFPPQQTIDFFEKLGIVCVEKENGKIYPRSLQASAVLDVLRDQCDELSILTTTGVEVIDVQRQGQDFFVQFDKGKAKTFQAVVIAAGGKASPKLASDGLGYLLLRALGHQCTQLYPALVQFRVKDSFIQPLKGIKCDANISLIADDVYLDTQYGELLFSEQAVSGPPIFQLSIRSAAYLLERPETQFKIVVDFFNEYSLEQLTSVFNKRKELLKNKELSKFFVGMLNKQIGISLFKRAQILPLARSISSLTEKEIHLLASCCKTVYIDIVENLPFANAQVTAGGMKLEEFDQNLQSKFYPKLYACGEVLDVLGDCGGFNLQWAWSSGYVVACATAAVLNSE